METRTRVLAKDVKFSRCWVEVLHYVHDAHFVNFLAILSVSEQGIVLPTMTVVLSAVPCYSDDLSPAF